MASNPKPAQLNVWSLRIEKMAAARASAEDPFQPATDQPSSSLRVPPTPPAQAPAQDPDNWPQVGKPAPAPSEGSHSQPTTPSRRSEKTKWVPIPPEELQAAADAAQKSRNPSQSHSRHRTNHPRNSSSPLHSSAALPHTRSHSGRTSVSHSTAQSRAGSLQSSPRVSRTRRLPADDIPPVVSADPASHPNPSLGPAVHPNGIYYPPPSSSAAHQSPPPPSFHAPNPAFYPQPTINGSSPPLHLSPPPPTLSPGSPSSHPYQYQMPLYGPYDYTAPGPSFAHPLNPYVPWHDYPPPPPPPRHHLSGHQSPIYPPPPPPHFALHAQPQQNDAINGSAVPPALITPSASSSSSTGRPTRERTMVFGSINLDPDSNSQELDVLSIPLPLSSAPSNSSVVSGASAGEKDAETVGKTPMFSIGVDTAVRASGSVPARLRAKTKTVSAAEGVVSVNGVHGKEAEEETVSSSKARPTGVVSASASAPAVGETKKWKFGTTSIDGANSPPPPSDPFPNAPVEIVVDPSPPPPAPAPALNNNGTADRSPADGDSDLEVKDYGYGFGDASGSGYASALAAQERLVRQQREVREKERIQRERERESAPPSGWGVDEVGSFAHAGYRPPLPSQMYGSPPEEALASEMEGLALGPPPEGPPAQGREYPPPSRGGPVEGPPHSGRGRRGYARGYAGSDRGGFASERGERGMRRGRGGMNGFAAGGGGGGRGYAGAGGRGYNSRGGASQQRSGPPPFSVTPPPHFQSLPLPPQHDQQQQQYYPPPRQQQGAHYLPPPPPPPLSNSNSNSTSNPNPTLNGYDGYTAAPPPPVSAPAPPPQQQQQQHHLPVPPPLPPALGLGLGLGPGLGLGGAPLPPPQSTIPFPLDPTRYWLLGQLEYYLSPQNMAQDFFLRQRMDARGWIPIPLLASFNRVKLLTGDAQLVRDVLALSQLVQVRGGMVRMGGWERFVLPDASPSAVEEQPLPGVYQAQNMGWWEEGQGQGYGQGEGQGAVGEVQHQHQQAQEQGHRDQHHHQHQAGNERDERPAWRGESTLESTEGAAVNGHDAAAAALDWQDSSHTRGDGPAGPVAVNGVLKHALLHPTPPPPPAAQEEFEDEEEEEEEEEEEDVVFVMGDEAASGGSWSPNRGS